MSALGSLEGYTVIDASSYVTGPFAAMMLADLGAEVIKVEPLRGDPLRRVGRKHDGYGISYANVNRNKRAVFLDLRDRAGVAELRRLVVGADALVTNWRPSTTLEIGFDERLLEENPRLVWVRISGFGPTGPSAESLAFDAVVQARTGMAWVQGDGEDATFVRGWVADKITSLFGAQALLAGLLARERTGQGRIVDVPMLDAVAYFNFPDVLVERTRIDANGPALNRHLSSYRPVETTDGWILLNPVAGRHMSAALTALGVESRKLELLAIADPADLARAFCEITETATRTGTTDRWIEVLEEAGVPVARILDLDEHLVDPQILHNGTYREVEHPVLGRIRAPQHPSAPGHPITPAPVLPEDQ